MAMIYYTVDGDDAASKIQEIEKEAPIETIAESAMALDFLVQDIVEVEYEKSRTRDDARTHFKISLWNSKKTHIVHNYTGFVHFNPYFVVRKIS